MDKKILKQIVEASYADGSLDKKRVEKIASLLSRKSLKQYIRALTLYEQQQSVFIDAPIDFEDADETMIEDIFPNKKIVYRKDPSLILGVQLIDNDIVFNMNLKNRLEELLDDIKQNYD